MSGNIVKFECRNVEKLKLNPNTEEHWAMWSGRVVSKKTSATTLAETLQTTSRKAIKWRESRRGLRTGTKTEKPSISSINVVCVCVKDIGNQNEQQNIQLEEVAEKDKHRYLVVAFRANATALWIWVLLVGARRKHGWTGSEPEPIGIPSAEPAILVECECWASGAGHALSATITCSLFLLPSTKAEQATEQAAEQATFINYENVSTISNRLELVKLIVEFFITRFSSIANGLTSNNKSSPTCKLSSSNK